MPIPTPANGESERDFIGRCMSTLAHTDPDRPQQQRAAICYGQWRHESVHPDFQRIMATFHGFFKDGSWLERFQKFIDGNRLDVTKPYSPAIQYRESFQWLKPQIEYYRKDPNAKYYKVRFLTASISMNNNDYSDWRKLQQSAPTLTVKPVNLNHDHKQWLPYPRTRVDMTEAEDLAIEGVLRVDNEDADLQRKLDAGEIQHPSIEGYRRPDGVVEFTASALLERGVDVPGDPLTEIVPLILNESVRNQLCNIVDGKIVCNPCVEPSQSEVNVKELSENKEAEKPYPNVDQFADPENRKYPIDCEHVMAAWSYINMPKNQGDYPSEKWATMKTRVKTAMKRCGHEVSEESTLDERDIKILRLSEANLGLQQEVAKTRKEHLDGQRDLAEKNRVLAEKERRIIELEALEPQLKARDGTVAAAKDELSAVKSRLEKQIEQNAANEKSLVDEKKACIDRNASLLKTIEVKDDDVKRLNESMATLKAHNDSLRKDVETLTRRSTESNEYARKAVQEKAELQVECAGLSDEVSTLTRKLADITESMTAKAKERYATSQDNEKLTEALRLKDQQVDSMNILVKKMSKVLRDSGYVWVDKSGNITPQ